MTGLSPMFSGTVTIIATLLQILFGGWSVGMQEGKGMCLRSHEEQVAKLDFQTSSFSTTVTIVGGRMH